MALPYNPPGVTITEVSNPVFSPILADPTTVCIVGPGQGYQSNTEILLLRDNAKVTLALDNIDVSTLAVSDATDPISGTTFRLSSNGVNRDYTLNQSSGQLSRAMQTTIASGETITLVYVENANWHTEQATLTNLNVVTPKVVPLNGGLDKATIVVFKAGVIPTSDYTISSSAGGSIVVQNSPTVLASSTKQTVWIDYTDASGNKQYDLALVLNGTTPVGFSGQYATLSGASAYVVKSAPGTTTVAAARYSLGSQTTLSDGGVSYNVETGDYLILPASPTVTTSNASSVTIRRSMGSTQMGLTAGTYVNSDFQQVRVNYQSTPADYYVPTRVFSQSDAESKYGPALDANGNIFSPISFAASIAFANGATSVIMQALFTLADQTNPLSARSKGGTTNSTSQTVTDWRNTLNALRDVPEITVLCPIVNASGGTYTDTNTLAIFEAVQDHVNFMLANGVFLMALLGEDSGAAGCVADGPALRSHATTLAARSHPEEVVLLSPAAFSYATSAGTTLTIGGQYATAALAGMMAARDVQDSLTHKPVIGLTGVADFRSEADKNTDASNGLLVVEAKNGVIRVRHAVTVSTTSAITREVSVQRAKNYVIQSLRDTFDLQVVGQVIVDEQAPFTIQTIAVGVLDSMVGEGVIAAYADIQVRQTSNDPTEVELRFSYLPIYPLNYVDIVFSLNTVNGTILTSSPTQDV